MMTVHNIKDNHDMGHDSGMSMDAMVRDMRNRFWICFVFTIPIFIYAPMGGLFKPPPTPFGLELNIWLFLLVSAAILFQADRSLFQSGAKIKKRLNFLGLKIQKTPCC